MKRTRVPNRRHAGVAAVVTAAFLLGACGTAGMGGKPGPPVPPPTYRVGDRWTYHGEEGFRVKRVWDETHEIAAIGPEGITVRITTTGPGLASERVERWQAPGVVQVGAVFADTTQRFEPALVRYQYPLTPGETWQQRIRDPDRPPSPFGPIQRWVTVGGYESVATPAGTFDALILRVIIVLDDETAFQWPTRCTGTIQYAPDAAAAARSEYSCWVRDKGDETAINRPGPNPSLQLTGFKRAP